MSTITDSFDQAQLSMAAYALNLVKDIAGPDYTEKLETAGMSVSQALAFATSYSVVDQYASQISGFSATVFRDITSGEVHFSIRGTESGFISGSVDWLLTNALDIGADGVAIHQGLELLNYLQRLYGSDNETVQQYSYSTIGFDKIVSTGLTLSANGLLSNQTDPISVTGHSLGGHLAIMMSRMAPNLVDSVHTFNAPGFDTSLWPLLLPISKSFPLTSSGFFSLLQNTQISPITGLTGPGWDTSIMSHLTVDGDLVNNIGSIPGVKQTLFTERANQGFVAAHGKEAITDALAVYGLFATLDSSQTIPQLTSIFKAGSAIPNESLENIVNAFGGIFNVGTTVATDDRNGLYQRIQDITNDALFQQSTGLVNLVSLSGLSPDALAPEAKFNTGILHALEELIPFAVVGDNGLYPSIDPAGYTEKYLIDRATLLEDKLIRATRDLPQSGVGQKFNGRGQYAGKFLHLIDRETGYSTHKFGNVAADAEMTIEFGKDDAGDMLGGTAGKNHLYGRGGDDYLDGLGKDDYLEGGDGSDTYNYTSGDGNDTIFDSDGTGQIVYDGLTLTGGEGLATSTNSYQDNDGFTFSLGPVVPPDPSDPSVGTDLVISKNGQAGSLTIKNFTDGNLGISLTAHQPLPPPPVIFQSDAPSFGGDNGDNFLEGLGGNNDIRGFDGNDRIWGGGGDDTIFGRQPTGSTYIPILTNDDDILRGGDGADLIFGGEGNDRIFGELGNDLLNGGLGNDYIDGGDNPDEIYGYYGTDIIYGGTGGDVIVGDDLGPESIVFDGVTYFSGSDWLYGEAGNDAIEGSHGDDFLYGGTGNDFLWGDLANDPTATGDDYINGGDGADTLRGGSGNDTLIGGDGDDFLLGEDDDDFMEGGAGLDQFDGGLGNDVMFGGADRDIMVAGFGDDFLSGDAGDDDLFGENGADVLAGGDGDDRLQAGSGKDVLQGGAGQDLLFGESGKDLLVGGDGDDQLDGGTGADTLIGGKGNDIIIADSSDTIIFRAGDGQDVVTLTSMNANIEFEGISPNALSVSQVPGAGSTQFLRLGFGADSMAIESGYLASSQIYNFDGQQLDQATLMQSSSAISVTGTNGNDIIYGSNQGDSISGVDGNDELYGQGGNDVLDGGLGNDHLDGGAGDDILLGGAGDDSYIVDSLNDTVLENQNEGTDIVEASVSHSLFADVENLTLTGGGAIDGDGNSLDNKIIGNNAVNNLQGFAGSDVLYGLAGDDTLTGGAGDDTLYGGKGDDVFVLELNGGTDNIIDLQGTNAIEFGAGILPTSLTPSTYQGDDGTFYLRIDYGVAGDYVLIKNGLSGAISEYRFQDDGSIMPHATLVGSDPLPVLAQGTQNDDVMSGSNQNDRLEGLAGNDSLSGAGGDDLLEGGKDSDFLYGGEGADILDGGTGNDTLQGGNGSDAYLLRWGMGEDTIIESDGGTNTLRLEDNITLGEVSAWVDGVDLVVQMNGISEGVRIKDYTLNSQPWQIQEAQGNSVALSSIVGLPTVTDVSDVMQRYRGQVRAALFSGLGANGYMLASDGSMQRTSNFNSFNSIRTTHEKYDLANTQQVDTVNTFINRISAAGVTSQTTLLSTSQTSRANENTTIGSSSLNTQGLGTFYTLDDFAVSGFSGVQIPIGGAFVAVSGEQSDINSIGYGTPGGSFGQQGYWVFDNASDASLGSGSSFTTVTHDVYQRDRLRTLEEITAGPAGNLINSGGYTLVDGGQGDDRITITGAGNAPSWEYSIPLDPRRIGAFVYGNDGDDHIFGGNENDTLMGGAGSNILNGRLGADTYVVLDGDSGTTLIADSGSLRSHPEVSFLTRYPGWFYGSLGKADWEDDVHNGVPLGVLPPNIARNDFEALEPLYEAGVFSIDTVEFGAGISQSNISVSMGQYTPGGDPDELYGESVGGQKPFGAELHQTLDITLSGGGVVRILLPNALDGGVTPGMSDGAYLSTVSRNMGAGIELFRFSDGSVLTMTEMLALDGSSSNVATNGDDVLTGTPGDDVINGLQGADQMSGGLGDDIYIVDNVGDTVTELAGEGTDKVISSIDYTLAAEIENLRLKDTALEGHGNALDNKLVGNDLNNRLFGEDGNDTLRGFAGDDELNGGAGDDLYRIDRGEGNDVISDSEASPNTDRVRYGSDIRHDQLWFTQLGNDLNISIIGTNDTVTISEWYSDTSNQVEKLNSGNGFTLLNSNVDLLVQAMAGFTPPANGELDLSPALLAQLDPVLTANWQ